MEWNDIILSLCFEVYTMCDVIKLEVKSVFFFQSLNSKSLQSQSLYSIQNIKNIRNITPRHVQDTYEMCEDRNAIESFDKYIWLQDRKYKCQSVWKEPCWRLVFFFSVSQLQWLDTNVKSPSSLRCSARDKKHTKSMYLRATARGCTICQGQGQFQSTPLSTSATSLRSPSPNKW